MPHANHRGEEEHKVIDYALSQLDNKVCNTHVFVEDIYKDEDEEFTVEVPLDMFIDEVVTNYEVRQDMSELWKVFYDNGIIPEHEEDGVLTYKEHRLSEDNGFVRVETNNADFLVTLEDFRDYFIHEI